MYEQLNLEQLQEMAHRYEWTLVERMGQTNESGESWEVYIYITKEGRAVKFGVDSIRVWFKDV